MPVRLGQNGLGCIQMTDKYFGNKKYQKSVLKIIPESTRETFSMSSPSKISKKSHRAFSLPAGPEFSCPGATNACRDCYAQKGRHFFKAVQSLLAANWNLMRSFEKEDDAVGCALEISKALPKSGIFRIHESGDFHSQFAVNVWALVVQANPRINFYAYTRSFNLNFSPLVQATNFMLWASTDKFNLKEAKEVVRKYRHYKVKHAYGPWKHGSSLPEVSFVCPVTNGKLAVEGACERCNLCILPNRTKKNVVFYIH